MPFAVRKKDNNFEVYRTDTGEVVATSDNESDAKITKRIKEQAAIKRGEYKRGSKPIVNMGQFVRKATQKTLAEEEITKVRTIDEREYRIVPREIMKSVSGAAVATFGLKAANGNWWVPIESFKALEKMWIQIQKDIKSQSHRLRINLAEEKSTEGDGFKKLKVTPEQFDKILKTGLLDGAIEESLDAEADAISSKTFSKEKKNLSFVKRAVWEVDFEDSVQLARKAGTPGVDREGNKGVWVQADSGPLFIRKGETGKTAFDRKLKNIERGGFLGPGHKETRRAYKRIWKQEEGDPIMRDLTKALGINREFETTKNVLKVAEGVKGAFYQEILSKRKMPSIEAKLRNFNEKIAGSIQGSSLYKRLIKSRDIYRRLAITYSSKIKKPVGKLIKSSKERMAINRLAGSTVMGV